MVRPALALMFGGALVVLTFRGTISGEAFLSVAGTVIAFYFGVREGQKQEQAVATAAAEQVVAQTVERRGANHEHEATVERRAPVPEAARRREPSDRG